MTPLVLVIMGVSGSGKTTVAEKLAEQLGWPFQEGDALHPAANVEKMRHGTPLTDEDRAPWLAVIADWVSHRVSAGEHGIITCSGLKRAYRDQITAGHQQVALIYLHGDRLTLEQHIQTRHHAFMPAALLDSQLATMEAPSPDEHVLQVEVDETVEQTVLAIRTSLHI